MQLQNLFNIQIQDIKEMILKVLSEPKSVWFTGHRSISHTTMQDTINMRVTQIVLNNIFDENKIG